MIIGTCIIELHLPGVHSLKQKRSVIKGLTARLHRQFNVSCGEVGLHDVWQSATLGVAMVSTSPAHAERVLEAVAAWIEHRRPDLNVIDHAIEVVNW